MQPVCDHHVIQNFPPSFASRAANDDRLRSEQYFFTFFAAYTVAAAEVSYSEPSSVWLGLIVFVTPIKIHVFYINSSLLVNSQSSSPKYSVTA